MPMGIWEQMVLHCLFKLEACVIYLFINLGTKLDLECRWPWEAGSTIWTLYIRRSRRLQQKVFGFECFTRQMHGYCMQLESPSSARCKWWAGYITLHFSSYAIFINFTKDSEVTVRTALCIIIYHEEYFDRVNNWVYIFFLIWSYAKWYCDNIKNVHYQLRFWYSHCCRSAAHADGWQGRRVEHNSRPYRRLADEKRA